MEYITVCESKITPKAGDEFISAAYKGKTYYFCEQECKDEFLHSPEKFLIEHKPAPPADPAHS